MNRNQSAWPQTQAPQTAWPANLQPAGLQGFPQGKQPLNEAEELLSTAVAWWDAKYYTEGDRWLRNRGTGGSALDARLGSSTVPNSNDPLFLKPEDSGYTYFPGTSNNYLAVPDEGSLDITGDLDIRCKVALDNWTPSGYQQLVSKGTLTGANQFSYELRVNPSGYLCLVWSVDGTGSVIGDRRSTAVVPATNGQAIWVRCTLQITPSSNSTTFYTSADGVNWSQLGSTPNNGSDSVSTAATTSVFSSTSRLVVGTRIASPTTEDLSGKVYRAQVFNGVDGTTVLDINCDTDIPSAEATSFTCSTGQTVTVNRATSGRKTVVMPSKTKGGSPVFLTGTDDYFEVQGRQQDQLVGFPASQDFTVMAVFRLFPATASGAILSKSNNSTGAGWLLAPYSTQERGYPETWDTNRRSAGGTTVGYFTQRTLTTLGYVYDRTAGTCTVMGANPIQAQSTSMAVVRDVISSHNVCIGRMYNASPYFSDMEFTAAMIFRRKLSQREITLIDSYYQSRIKQTWVDPTDAAQKTFLASKLGISEATYSDALDILKSADFYVDSRSYDGSNYWKNLGKRGSSLNMRLGSTQGSDSNDPKYLAPESSGFVYLPGVLGNYLSIPDENALDIAGDIDLRAYVMNEAWTGASGTTTLICKDDFSSQRSYSLDLNNTYSAIQIAWTTSGAVGTRIAQRSTVAVPFVNNQAGWVRATLDVDNGAGGYTIKFYTSTDGSNWTQLGDTVTGGSTTSIYAGTAAMQFGCFSDLTQRLTGKVYRAQVFSGIDGTKVLDIDCDQLVDGRQTSFQALTGQTVTISRSSSGRKSVAVPNTSVKTMDAANVYLPGVASNYLTTSDPGTTTQPPMNLVFDGPFLWLEKDGVTLPNETQSTSLRVRGDLDIQGRIALDDWTPAQLSYIVSKLESNLLSYSLAVNTGGTLVLVTSPDGTATVTSTSTSALPVTDGTPLWVRATMDVDNGASGNTVRFYYSYDGDLWTALGNAVTNAGTTSIYSGTNQLQIGRSMSGPLFQGRIYRTIIKDGLAGTTVLDADCSVITSSSQSSFTATTGQTVTINSTANSGLRVNPLKQGAGVPVFLLGTDDYFEMEGSTQHDLFNILEGQDFSMLAVYRRWNYETSTWVAKKNDFSGSTPGWAMFCYLTGTVTYMDIHGGTGANGPRVTSELGPLSSTVGVRKYGTSTFSIYNANKYADGSWSTGSTANTISVKIGSASTNYCNGEIVAIALFRNRGISTAEVATLTSFFNC